jgi:nucleoid DNA-binding protein
MTKAELIDAVASSAGTNKADAEKVITAFFDTVVATGQVGRVKAYR